eukprot:GDKI01021202.1.p1 GENE.GDKI01021202.1~~GDKI01021202.1.p1  ORF type:complete len:566 (-),score=134.32 GDKI01021202.1:471-2168(-)
MPVVERRGDTETAVGVYDWKQGKYVKSIVCKNRFALVVGNNDYEYGKKLDKAVNDATDVHRMLNKAGFQSTLLCNATFDELLEEEEALVEAVRAYVGQEPPVVCVFFSGHGMDKEKRTHLLVVDRKDHGLEVDTLLSDLNVVAKGMTFLLLTDACREDPLNTTFQDDGRRGVAAATLWADMLGIEGAEVPTFRSVGLGDDNSAKGGINPNMLLQRANGNRFFLAFACKPGTFALENMGERNGYFTKALLEHLTTPGKRVMHAFENVVEDVLTWTKHRQGPWSEGDMPGKLVLFPDSTTVLDEKAKDAVTYCPEIHEYITQGDEEGVLKLLEEGVSVNALNSEQEKRTPLHTAMVSGHEHIGRLLLDRGADVNAADWSNTRPLHFGAGRLDLLDMLLDFGANPNAKNIWGSTPLHDICGHQNGDLEVATRILERGANVNEHGHHGFTPLHMCKNLPDTARLFLEWGADVNLVDVDGRTVLHHACMIGDMKSALLYIEKGCDIKQADKEGATVLHLRLGEKVDSCKKFIELGADVNAKDKYGKSPLMNAMARKNTPLIELLRSNGAV